MSALYSKHVNDVKQFWCYEMFNSVKLKKQSDKNI